MVTVEGRSIELLEYNGQPVVTMTQIAGVHGISRSNVTSAFYQNKDHLILGSDYLVICREDVYYKSIVRRGGGNKGVIVFTERGYLKLVKTFGDDLAWAIQGKLVDAYFHHGVAPTATPAVAPPADAMAALRLFFAAMDQQGAQVAALAVACQRGAQVAVLAAATTDFSSWVPTCRFRCHSPRRPTPLADSP